MASYGGIDLEINRAEIANGAGFKLNKPSPLAVDHNPETGIRVAIRKDSIALVTFHTNPRDDPDSLLQAAHEAAQKTLDAVAAKHMHFLSLPHSEYEHELWWREADQTVIRLSDIASLSVRVDATWTLTKADGTKQSSEDEPLPNWHEAFRYFRYSQLRDDLYAGYREMFLGVESLLSSWDAKRPGESEEAWLTRVCRRLEKNGLDFKPLMNGPSADPPRDFVGNQYKAHRCALFHAKAGQPALLPGALEDRRLVASALQDLGEFAKRANRLILGFDSSVGALTFAGIQHHVNTFASELELAVSPDATPVDAADTAISPRGNVVTAIPTSYEGVIDGVGYTHGFLGRIGVADLASKLINTTASSVPDALMTRGNVPSLDVDGFDWLESRLVWFFAQRGGLKGGFDL